MQNNEESCGNSEKLREKLVTSVSLRQMKLLTAASKIVVVMFFEYDGMCYRETYWWEKQGLWFH